MLIFLKLILVPIQNDKDPFNGKSEKLQPQY